MDKISPRNRSLNMSRILSKNTQPEIILRQCLFKNGLRFRIHFNIPGKPDIVFPGKKVAVFVNGCFWHGHGCELDHIPKSNNKFWDGKFLKNKQRDKKVNSELRVLGWKIIVAWECGIQKNTEKIVDNILKALAS